MQTNIPTDNFDQTQESTSLSNNQSFTKESKHDPVNQTEVVQKKSRALLFLICFLTVSIGITVYFAYQNYQLKTKSEKYSSSQEANVTPSIIEHKEKQSEKAITSENKLLSYMTNEGLVLTDVLGNNKKIILEKTAEYPSWDWNPVANEVVTNSSIIKNLDTGEERIIPDGRCHNWSPDGSKIAFENNGELFYMSTTDLKPIKISNHGMLCGGSNSVFHWSPDSKSLIYLTDNGALYTKEIIHSIMKYDFNNQSSIEIYQDEQGSGQIRSPSISSDGTKVVFMMSVDKGDNSSQLTENIYIINIDGSNLTQLTDLETDGEYGQMMDMPIFSQDDQSIFVTSNVDSSKYRGLSMIDINTKAITKLADEIANTYLPATISPDGQYVAYNSDDIIIINLQSKEKTTIESSGFALWQK